ncbi:MAG TPA: hypothetical protein VI895_01830 [Bdellovibrionota bacterium]|nr:hypothetical protein [Bdellovibrionota bacterium]
MADEVMQKSARANRDDGNVVSTTKRGVKALKGETHERWELKEASKDGETKSAVRVAKPCERGFLREGQNLQDVFSKGR